MSAPIASALSIDKKNLRRHLRERRRALSPAAQRRAAQRAAATIARRPEFVSADHIAVYLAADGELDPSPLIALARAAGKRIYLPVLRPGSRLRFAQWREGARLHRNRLGLYEPGDSRFLPERRLDLVLMPLVGFDRGGGRLGMGGGFYDRTFAFIRQDGRRRPRLVGLAHACQEVAQLAVEAWDVPMAAIVTDHGWISVRRSKQE